MTQWLSESVSESVTRSPIELFWTAKNCPPDIYYLCTILVKCVSSFFFYRTPRSMYTIWEKSETNRSEKDWHFATVHCIESLIHLSAHWTKDPDDDIIELKLRESLKKAPALEICLISQQYKDQVIFHSIKCFWHKTDFVLVTLGHPWSTLFKPSF